MKRRVLMAGMAVLPALPARAQKVPHVGVIWHAASAEKEGEYFIVFMKALADLGYVDGRTVKLTQYFPDERAERFRSAARELVDAKVDLIVTVTLQGAREAKQATNTIPIVMVFAPDPVRAGMVESLARPGGNVTGLSSMATDLSSKHLSLMKEAVPSLAKLGLLIDPGMPGGDRAVAAYEAAARPLGLALQTAG
ncbi:MAG: hypothetical protein JOY81_09315, partial [Alphaproteobacteria bacterium]|nr:hypothetical protein [Alphaproteobacteria bacterium]